MLVMFAIKRGNQYYDIIADEFVNELLGTCLTSSEKEIRSYISSNEDKIVIFQLVELKY